MSLTDGFQLLERRRLRVGRASECEIVLAHDSVSKLHAELTRTEDGYELIDLMSVNGTTVNGQPIKEARALRDGDLIVIGMFQLAFRRSGDIEVLEVAAAGVSKGGTERFDFMTMALRRASTGSGFEGEELRQFCSLLLITSRAGRLRVKGEGLAGEIEFQDGGIVGARAGNRRGVEATRALLTTKNGWYRFEGVTAGGARREHIADLQTILYELSDEG